MPDVIREDVAPSTESTSIRWEMPKMNVDFFTDHYGFVVDYCQRPCESSGSTPSSKSLIGLPLCPSRYKNQLAH